MSAPRCLPLAKALAGLAGLLLCLPVAAAEVAPGDVVPGAWGQRAAMLAPNSEFTVAELDRKLYVLGGYPASRTTVRTVQIYDIATDTWRLGPPLPEPTNHGMATSLDGVIYLIGGQSDPGTAYVDGVFALDPKTGQWTAKAKMPTKRSAGVAIPFDGKIYVAGGRPPRGSDFAVYDPKTDSWEALPSLPSQRNHIAGFAFGGKLHVAGGRLEGGFQSAKTAVMEVYDPKTRSWSVAAPMLKPRSGINGVLANGCFHVWGGEEAAGLFADHDYYDPRANKWTKLPDMPIPVHGVTGAAFVDGLIWVTGGGTAPGGSSGSLLNQVYRPAVRCE